MLVIDMACECMNNKKTTRSEEDKKKLISRINRIKGQLDGINKMVEDDRYCADILIQLSAADKAIKSLASVILDNHMHSCVLDGIKEGDLTKIDEIVDLFRRFS
ncbi:MAG: metal-sensing transcriptional repressor [Acholeplasmatales bacterium]|jgi:DNA-binding FrmR family transcriptional regulator|nr:metal-sensing transcriptional repressor [Acholeplasmatales bacterium]